MAQNVEPFNLVKTPSPHTRDESKGSRLAEHFGGLSLTPEQEKRHAEQRAIWKTEYTVGPHVLNQQQYLAERAKHSYTRDVLERISLVAANLPKPSLPVLSCTVPEEYQRPIEDLRASSGLRSSGRRGLKSSTSNISNGVIPLSMLPPNPNVPSSGHLSNLIPEGFISPRLVNRAAELTASTGRASLINSRGEMISLAREAPPTMASPLVATSTPIAPYTPPTPAPTPVLNNSQTRPIAPPGFESQNLLEKIMNAERRAYQIDVSSESSPVFDPARARLRSSQESFSQEENLAGNRPNYANYNYQISQSSPTVPLAKPIGNNLSSSSSSLYNNSPAISPANGRYTQPNLSSSGSVSGVFSPAPEPRNAINFSQEGPPTKRGGYNIPPGEVYSPKPRQNYIPNPPGVRRVVGGTPIMSPSISTHQSYNHPLPYAPVTETTTNQYVNESQDSTSFITSLLSTSTSSPAPVHKTLENLPSFGSQMRAPGSTSAANKNLEGPNPWYPNNNNST